MRAMSSDQRSTVDEADYVPVAQMMINHLRRAGQPFVTPEAVEDFVGADKVEVGPLALEHNINRTLENTGPPPPVHPSTFLSFA